MALARTCCEHDREDCPVRQVLSTSSVEFHSSPSSSWLHDIFLWFKFKYTARLGVWGGTIPSVASRDDHGTATNPVFRKKSAASGVR